MATQELADEYEHVAVELPPGRRQIEYDAETETWLPRGGVLRCVISDEDRKKGPTIHIDDNALTFREFGKLLEVYSGWGMRVTFVPDDELHEEPTIEVREPTHEER
jgi:hypothetical protein